MKKRCRTTLSGNRTLGMTMNPIGPQSKNLFTFIANLGPNTNKIKGIHKYLLCIVHPLRYGHLNRATFARAASQCKWCRSSSKYDLSVCAVL